MKKVIALLIVGFIATAGAYADEYVHGSNINQTLADLQQLMQGLGYSQASGGEAVATGGSASAESVSAAVSGDTMSAVVMDSTSISNYKTRTPPLSTVPPYLPYWTHGGWGTLKAYFPNGPTSNDQVYERTFNPADPDDMRELRGVLASLPHDGPLGFLGSILNGVGALFGGPDYFHRGRGFEIGNALIRDRRPAGKPLVVFIDSNVDRNLLEKAGYVYVGKVSLEGKIDRNWDHVYDAAVAETLPWDVDILLISGGMKGVTIGSTLAFPGGAGGYSQVNYSLSLFGGFSNGITEGKGKAIVSAEGYRYWPEAANRRRIPKFLYDKFRKQPTPTGQTSAKALQETPKTAEAPVAAQKPKPPGVEISQQLYEMAGFKPDQPVQNVTIK
jgi:hypothetical protein